tara:strand:+ start:507 stop:692 length:186 start_codon:yes stop_codon:yes gene_type:complete
MKKNLKKQNKIKEAGQRALKEASERNKNIVKRKIPLEIDGPNGIEPTRFGDWEKKGIASDF